MTPPTSFTQGSITVSAVEFAKALEGFVRADMAAEPKLFADAVSWSSLHDVCDANDFVQSADERFGLDMGMLDNGGPLSDAYFTFVNESTGIAQAALFPDFKPGHPTFEATHPNCR
jgi:hypothetical protein